MDPNTQSAPSAEPAATSTESAAPASNDLDQSIESMESMLESYRGDESAADESVDAAEPGSTEAPEPVADAPADGDDEDPMQDAAFVRRLEKVLARLPQQQPEPERKPDQDKPKEPAKPKRDLKAIQESLSKYDPDLAAVMGGVLDEVAELRAEREKAEQERQALTAQERESRQVGELRDALERRINRIADEYGSTIYGAGPNREIREEAHKKARRDVGLRAYALLTGHNQVAERFGVPKLTVDQAVEIAERSVSFDHVRGAARNDVSRAVKKRESQKSLVPGAAPKAATGGLSAGAMDSLGKLVAQYQGKA